MKLCFSLPRAGCSTINQNEYGQEVRCGVALRHRRGVRLWDHLPGQEHGVCLLRPHRNIGVQMLIDCSRVCSVKKEESEEIGCCVLVRALSPAILFYSISLCTLLCQPLFVFMGMRPMEWMESDSLHCPLNHRISACYAARCVAQTWHDVPKYICCKFIKCACMCCGALYYLLCNVAGLAEERVNSYILS